MKKRFREEEVLHAKEIPRSSPNKTEGICWKNLETNKEYVQIEYAYSKRRMKRFNDGGSDGTARAAKTVKKRKENRKLRKHVQPKY